MGFIWWTALSFQNMCCHSGRRQLFTCQCSQERHFNSSAITQTLLMQYLEEFCMADFFRLAYGAQCFRGLGKLSSLLFNTASFPLHKAWSLVPLSNACLTSSRILRWYHIKWLHYERPLDRSMDDIAFLLWGLKIKSCCPGGKGQTESIPARVLCGGFRQEFASWQ